METLISIPVIEAVKTYISVWCENLDQDTFKVLNDHQFDIDDNTILYKYFPGDIVKTSNEELRDLSGSAKMVLVATRLIGEYSLQRRVKTFQYLIADQQGIFTEKQIKDYSHEIDYLKKEIYLKEINSNLDFHPAVLRWYSAQQNK